MRLGRYEFGKWKYLSPIELKDYFEISYDKGICGCHLFTLSLFYFTVLSDECYYSALGKEELDER